MLLQGSPSQVSGNSQYAPYSSLKQNIMNASKAAATGSQGSKSGNASTGKLMSTTMVYQNPNLHYKHGQIGILNPAATAQVHPHNYHAANANSLDQYGAGANHYQFASINQSLLIRNLNYSILQGELEHEAALEDMHMFFVAFNKR
jgi:hypothetical protein